MPRFSVVVPAYNSAETITAAVTSVLAQSITDLEVIVVDDGSVDDTARIASDIDDDRVRCVSQPNGGPSAARNTGISLAQGEYVSFIDGDDLWLPSYLSATHAALTSTPNPGFAYMDAYAFDDATGKVRIRSAMGRMRPPEPPPSSAADFLLELLQRNFIYNSVTIPMSVLRAEGGYDEALLTGEDYELWLRLLVRGYAPAWVSGRHALYRLHPGQATRRINAMTAGVLSVFEGLSMDDMPSDAHRELLLRRRRETKRKLRPGARALTSLMPQKTVARLKRRGIAEAWYSPAPPEIRAAFPDMKLS